MRKFIDGGGILAVLTLAFIASAGFIGIWIGLVIRVVDRVLSL